MKRSMLHQNKPFLILSLQYGGVRGTVHPAGCHGERPVQMSGQPAAPEEQVWERLHAAGEDPRGDGVRWDGPSALQRLHWKHLPRYLNYMLYISAGQCDGFYNFHLMALAGSLLKDEHQGMVHYHLTDKTLTWAQVRLRNMQSKHSDVPIYIYAFSRRFYPKRLTVHSGYTFFSQYVCSLGIEPMTFCAANAMLNHWATGTPFRITYYYFCSMQMLCMYIIHPDWPNCEFPTMQGTGLDLSFPVWQINKKWSQMHLKKILNYF